MDFQRIENYIRTISRRLRLARCSTICCALRNENDREKNNFYHVDLHGPCRLITIQVRLAERIDCHAKQIARDPRSIPPSVPRVNHRSAEHAGSRNGHHRHCDAVRRSLIN